VASVASAVRELFEHAWLELPLPGSKDTRTRFRCFVELGAHDLSLARLCESHADAIAILREAGREPAADAVYGVWASDSTASAVRAECTPEGWQLQGELAGCYGVSSVDRALILASSPEPMLFDVPRAALDRLEIEHARAVGLAAADGGRIKLDRCELPVDALVGPPGFQRSRRGRWSGAIGVSAVWFGGAVGAYRAWQSAKQGAANDPHAQAHLGAAYAAMSAAGQVLHDAAHAIDAGESSEALRRRALWTRHVVETSCLAVLDRMGRALGDAPSSWSAAHARRLADLPAYLRQSQAERDLASLGQLVSSSHEVAWL